MNCMEVQKNIQPFINDRLSLKDLEEYLHHMETCDSCREEYEVYYMLLMGMKILDEEENISEKFHLDSGEKLGTAKEYLQKKKRSNLVIRSFLGMIIVFFIICM